MENKSQQVNERFPQANCAQTVFSLHAKELGITEELALKIASGFGGGMACAETCGAITGAYMVIGLKHGHTTNDPDAKAMTKEKIKLFNKKFTAVHGSLICKTLTGYDISTPEGANEAATNKVFSTKCPLFIKTACTILANDF